MEPVPLDARLEPLAAALAARPSVAAVLGGVVEDSGLWSVTLAIDLGHADAWEEIRRFAWLFNNLYGAVPDGVLFRPLTLEDRHGAERHLCWVLEALYPDYSPDRALDVLMTPMRPFEPPIGPA